MKRVHFDDDIEYQRSPPPPTQSTKEDDVFGTSLNKKPKKKMNGDFYIGGRREGEGERKSVWKLRRWSKSRGHHTVVVKKEGEEKEEGREGEQKREENNKDMAGSEPSGDKASNEVCVYTVYGSTLSMIIYNGHEIPLSISAII